MKVPVVGVVEGGLSKTIVVAPGAVAVVLLVVAEYVGQDIHPELKLPVALYSYLTGH